MTTSDAVENVTDESTQEPTGDGYLQPTVDVAALTTLLDGKYADVRALVRGNLAEHSRSSWTPRR